MDVSDLLWRFVDRVIELEYDDLIETEEYVWLAAEFERQNNEYYVVREDAFAPLTDVCDVLDAWEVGWPQGVTYDPEKRAYVLWTFESIFNGLGQIAEMMAADGAMRMVRLTACIQKMDRTVYGQERLASRLANLCQVTRASDEPTRRQDDDGAPREEEIACVDMST